MIRIKLNANPQVGVMMIHCLCLVLIPPEVYSVRKPLVKLSEQEMTDIFLNITTARSTKLKQPLLQRTSKRQLPPNGTLFGQKFNPMECDGTYSVPANGYILFDLNSDSKTCHYSLLGSKNEGCTVAVLCDGTIDLEPETKLGCENEFLILTDGTIGIVIGCGKFSFKNSPRYPLNNGSDMYVYVKGSNAKVVCIAFCKEDLELDKYPGVKAPTRLSENKKYTGLWTETQCKCGIRRNMGRIVGGENARINEFPWIVGLVYPGTRKPFCGGSLINDRYVLSAGHCFQGNSLSKNKIEVLIHAHVMDQNKVKGRTGDFNKIPGWNLPVENDTTESSIRLRVIEIRQHPLYDYPTFDYDFVILKLEQPINLVDPNILVEPICLPPIAGSDYQDNVMMTVAGWGIPWEGGPATSRVLQKVDVPHVNRGKCKQYTWPTARHICAGYLQGGKDSCSGDSGGPLISVLNPSNNQYFLSGIVSCGAGCARRDQLGMYSDVKEITQWIYFHTSGAVWCER